MRSPPPVPPKDSPKMSSTTEARPKRDGPRSCEKIPTTTKTSPTEDPTQHQPYVELTRGHILPEVVFGLHNHATHNSQKIPCATESNRPISQIYPEVSYSELTQDGSLPQMHELENYPQVYTENEPEALNRGRSVPYALEATEQARPTRTICGLRRLWFWVILTTIAVMALIVAIVGGVLGSRAAKANSKTTLLPTAALAAVNYTEGNGVQHHRVYFQAKSNALYQSAWNSSGQKWHVSPLNPRSASGPEIKPGTPLAAYTLNDGIHSAIEYHIFFLDTENRIWERASYDPDDMWSTQTENAMNGTLFAGNSSKLAAYSQQCDRYCAQTSILVYQDFDYSLWWAAYISDYGWYAQAAKADSNHSLVTGSSLSLAPIWTNDSSTVALYANTGSLTRFIWYQLTAWENSWSYNRSFPAKLESDTEIASFSLGYNAENDSMSDMEVLLNGPETPGGVRVWDSNFSTTNFSNNSAAASAFSSDFNLSTVVASAGGRVYAVEGEKLVEWEWQHGNRSFVRLGTVNTDIVT
ncbi:hypothetical protein B0J12DRAFT_701238 [Macrophomina phaseolina]|uniref:Fucose-specific lectin n=1 Tax=Macrophomina phaseolina TaxID=35725 RepID=A0ABQ8G4Z5_9PEZI|nr:hypothetical protein B0J12DRAFT_701238 [Macrophomina phaseolina]